MIAELSLQRLRAVLDYDTATGVLTWRYDPLKPANINARDSGKRAGGLDKDGYRQVMVDGRNYRAARLIWFYVTGAWPPTGIEIDHKNRRHDDNWWDNLRLATPVQNRANTSSRNPKGVSWSKNANKWRAKFKGDHLGYFDDPTEAAAAYRDVAVVHHGEFAR